MNSFRGQSGRYDETSEDIHVLLDYSYYSVDVLNGQAVIDASNCFFGSRINNTYIKVKGNSNLVAMHRNMGIVDIEGDDNRVVVVDRQYVGIVRVKRGANNKLNDVDLEEPVLQPLPSPPPRPPQLPGPRPLLESPSLFSPDFNPFSRGFSQEDNSLNLWTDFSSPPPPLNHHPAQRDAPVPLRNRENGITLDVMLRNIENFATDLFRGIENQTQHIFGGNQRANNPRREHNDEVNFQDLGNNEDTHGIETVLVEPTARSIPDVCPICQEHLEKGRPGTSYLDCLDWFHEECIAAWLSRGHTTCPKCRNETQTIFKVPRRAAD